jgi:hypothetical protein
VSYQIGDKLIRKPGWYDRMSIEDTIDPRDVCKSISVEQVIYAGAGYIKCVSDIDNKYSKIITFGFAEERYDKVTDQKKPLKLKDLL